MYELLFCVFCPCVWFCVFSSVAITILRENWLPYFNCVLAVMYLLVFVVSSTWCHGMIVALVPWVDM